MTFSRRLDKLPPYLFAEIDALKSEALAKGVDLIDFGVGDPDNPTPAIITEELRAQALRAANHRYPPYQGIAALRRKVTDILAERRGVALHPDREVLILNGSKEGIAHLPLALIDPGSIALVPEPGYPVYHSATMFAGGSSYILPLTASRGYLPHFDEIPEKVLQKCRLLFLNYPNNPTAGVATPEFFQEVVRFAKKYDIIVCHDASYVDITFGDKPAPSFLEAEGAKEVGVEFYSFSKSFNMTGWRLAFAVGNAEVLKALGNIKKNIDSGVFNPVQYAGIVALEHYEEILYEVRKVYQQRRRIMEKALRYLDRHFSLPQGTFYLWVPTPGERSAVETTRLFLSELGIVVTPGTGFGTAGEGYIRFSLTLPTESVIKGAERIKEKAHLLTAS